MKKIKEIIVSVCILGLLVSCNNVIDIDDAELFLKETEAHKAATDFVLNSFAWGCMRTGRSAVENTDVIKMMDAIEMYDEDTGEAFLFSELDMEHQNALFQAYQEEIIEEYSKMLEEDENLLKIIIIDNLAIQDMLKQSERSLILQKSEEMQVKQFLKKRNELVKQLDISFERSSSSGKSNSNKIESKDLNRGKAELLRKSYGDGRVLVCADSSSESSSSGLGHAAIMVKKFWDQEGNYSGDSQCSISAWPDDGKTAWWDGKRDGVQYEPIAYWAGTATASANDVYVVQMKKKFMSVKWKGIIPQINSYYDEAPTSDVKKAVDYAKKQEIAKKPYNAALNAPLSIMTGGAAKYFTGTFYCSQLVWRSWLSAGVCYDVSLTLPVVLPEQFLNKTFVYEKEHYYNKKEK